MTASARRSGAGLHMSDGIAKGVVAEVPDVVLLGVRIRARRVVSNGVVMVEWSMHGTTRCTSLAPARVDGRRPSLSLPPDDHPKPTPYTCRCHEPAHAMSTSCLDGARPALVVNEALVPPLPLLQPRQMLRAGGPSKGRASSMGSGLPSLPN